jgi:hypothetical protein
MEVIDFGLFDVLDGFSGDLSFDHRDLGNFFLAEGIIHCLFNFVVVHQNFIAPILLSPIVWLFEEVTGCPVVLVVSDSLWAAGGWAILWVVLFLVMAVTRGLFSFLLSGATWIIMFCYG